VDLLQFASGSVTERSASPAEVVGDPGASHLGAWRSRFAKEQSVEAPGVTPTWAEIVGTKLLAS